MTKATKESVYYGPGHAGEHCVLCRHYVAGGACAIVQGEIRADYWCIKFERGRDNDT